MKRILMVVSLVLLVAGCTVGGTSQVTVTTTPSATATTSSASWDGQDDTFLAQVALISELNGTTKADKISLAHSVCLKVEAGNKVEVLKILMEQYGIEAAAKFMHASISVYCPDQLVG